MPRKPNEPPVRCEFFTWRMFQRDGVYYADGRCSGQSGVGKHSLGTRDRGEAMDRLRMLDRKLAVDQGLCESVSESSPGELSIEEGWRRYMEYCGRPQVMKGVSEGTLKRYRAVRDKHLQFCATKGLRCCLQINRQTTEQYGSWLAKNEYADRSMYLELTLIASLVKWLIEERLLPTSSLFRMSLSKPDGSDTHCYSREEVAAMTPYCRSRPELAWLGDILTGLASTGMRIGEFVSLKWRDIDFAANTIRLTDERSSVRRRKIGTVRTVKGKRGRALPLHRSFREVLLGMPHHPDGHVFHGPRGGRLKPDLIRRKLISDVIEPLKSRFPTPEGDIGFEHGRLHSFRHFFVSECFRQGVSEAQIMEWVGHRDSAMVRLYRHLRTDDSHRQMSELDFGTGAPADGETRDREKTA